MRRVRTDNALSAIPAGGYVEVFQASQISGDDDAGPQFALAGTLGADDLAAAVAGGGAAITPTVGGGTTGLIPATSSFAEVTSTDADEQISLPAAIAGKVIRIFVDATGVELISVVAGDRVNGVVVGVTNEAALIHQQMYTLVYDGTDNWTMTSTDVNGVVVAPIVPDALV